MNAKLPFMIRKKQILALQILGFLVLLLYSFRYFYPDKKTVEIENNLVWVNDTIPKTPLFLSEFDPNELDEKQWQTLGFTERQAKTILKYKEIVGGQFKSKAQLKKCYAISSEKFEELNAFILLPENNNSKFSPSDSKFNKKELTILGKFNPDNYNPNDWQKMGFSEKQSSAIDKYKHLLGGSFVSKEKFKECFIISEENYAKLAPYLLLPDKTPSSFVGGNYKKENKLPVIHYAHFNPNILDKEGWEAIGFSEKQAAIIVNYRDKILGGNFRNTEEIKKCFVISESKFNEIEPYIQLVAIEKPNLVTSKNSTEVVHPTNFAAVDVNIITYKQLIEFGFTEKDAAMMLSFRKKLGGFVDKKQMAETFEIDKEKAEKLSSIAQLNSDGVAKYSLVEAPEDWLKTHPYFKFSAERIIFYRISNPDEKKILKFLKLKPEYEVKMRMYMK
jgi:hypothetical protein